MIWFILFGVIWAVIAGIIITDGAYWDRGAKAACIVTSLLIATLLAFMCNGFTSDAVSPSYTTGQPVKIVGKVIVSNSADGLSVNAISANRHVYDSDDDGFRPVIVNSPRNVLVVKTPHSSNKWLSIASNKPDTVVFYVPTKALEYR